MRSTRGFSSVFKFTSRQYWKRNGFARTTIIFAVLLFLGATALIFFLGRPKKNKVSGEEEPEKRTIVHILNKTEFEDIIPKEEEPLDGSEAEPLRWDFDYADGTEDAVFAAIADKEREILAIVEKVEEGGKTTYRTRVKIPNKSDIGKGEAMEAGDAVSEAVKKAVYESVNMTEAMIAFVMIEPTARSVTTDDEVSLLNMLIKSILPAILGLVLYMLILMHGQTICKEVSVEKTSKLMETMLVSVEPNALILGKTLALSVLALGQFMIWVASAVLGLFAGGFIGRAVYADDFTNKLVTVFNYLREYIGGSALSPAAIIMSVIVFCFGTFIYFALAAMGGSFVSKPEETASANSMFVFPLLVFWMLTYFATLTGSESVVRVLRYIPFTAPFCVPVDVLTGNMSLLGGAIVCIEVMAAALFVIWLAARIYRGLMLHTGQKLSFKTVWATICGR